jgi:hypothetical protein
VKLNIIAGILGISVLLDCRNLKNVNSLKEMRKHIIIDIKLYFAMKSPVKVYVVVSEFDY